MKRFVWISLLLGVAANAGSCMPEHQKRTARVKWADVANRIRYANSIQWLGVSGEREGETYQNRYFLRRSGAFRVETHVDGASGADRCASIRIYSAGNAPDRAYMHCLPLERKVERYYVIDWSYGPGDACDMPYMKLWTLLDRLSEANTKRDDVSSDGQEIERVESRLPWQWPGQRDKAGLIATVQTWVSQATSLPVQMKIWQYRETTDMNVMELRQIQWDGEDADALYDMPKGGSWEVEERWTVMIPKPPEEGEARVMVEVEGTSAVFTARDGEVRWLDRTEQPLCVPLWRWELKEEMSVALEKATRTSVGRKVTVKVGDMSPVSRVVERPIAGLAIEVYQPVKEAGP